MGDSVAAELQMQSATRVMNEWLNKMDSGRRCARQIDVIEELYEPSYPAPPTPPTPPTPEPETTTHTDPQPTEGEPAEPAEPAEPTPPPPPAVVAPAKPPTNLLGRGNYGVVKRYALRADCPDPPPNVPTNEPVAVKVLSKQLMCRSLTNIKHLMVEVEVLRHIKHENVVRLYDVAYCTDNIYIVMELCNGGDLYELLRSRRSLEAETAAIILKQLLTALHHIHSCHVVHRDIKPENVIVDPKDYHVKVVDFGTAKYCGPAGIGIGSDLPQSPATGTSGSNSSGSPQVLNTAPPSPLVCATPGAGTFLYMALEGLEGVMKGTNVDESQRSKWLSSKSQLSKLDVYAAGVTAYVMLVGRLPYKSAFKATEKAVNDLSGKISQGFPVHHAANKELPEDSLECVRDLMSSDLKVRPTALEAMSHPFLKDVVVPTRHKLPQNVTAIVEISEKKPGRGTFMIAYPPRKKGKQPPRAPVEDLEGVLEHASSSRSGEDSHSPPQNQIRYVREGERFAWFLFCPDWRPDCAFIATDMREFLYFKSIFLNESR